MSKTILMLTPFFSPNIGGAETFIDSLIEETIKCHNVTVLTFQPFNQKMSDYEQKKKHMNLLKVYRLTWFLKQSKAWQGMSLRNAFSVIPQMAVKSFSLLRTNHFDLIHAHGLLSGFVAVLLKKIFKKKVFITLLAIYNFDKSFILKTVGRFILKNCDIIFVEGENGQRDLRGLGHDLKVRIFYHWCNQDLFTPEKIQDERLRVLFIGRPTHEKGRHIIEGAEKLLSNSKYEFKYIENISYSELPSIYKKTDIVCIPSLYAEGYSRVVIESASCGCAIITSNNGSLPEMVRDFGISIYPSIENFASWISAPRFIESGKDAYEYARINFSPKNAEVFLNEYNR